MKSEFNHALSGTLGVMLGWALNWYPRRFGAVYVVGILLGLWLMVFMRWVDEWLERK